MASRVETNKTWSTADSTVSPEVVSFLQTRCTAKSTTAFIMKTTIEKRESLIAN